MARAADFIRQIAELHGVKSCILMKDSGEILFTNFHKPGNYHTPWVRQVVAQGNIVGQYLGSNSLDFITITSESNDHFHIFPFRQYLLIIQQPENMANDNLGRQVRSLIHELLERHGYAHNSSVNH